MQAASMLMFGTAVGCWLAGAVLQMRRSFKAALVMYTIAAALGILLLVDE